LTIPEGSKWSEMELEEMSALELYELVHLRDLHQELMIENLETEEEEDGSSMIGECGDDEGEKLMDFDEDLEFDFPVMTESMFRLLMREKGCECGIGQDFRFKMNKLTFCPPLPVVVEEEEEEEEDSEGVRFRPIKRFQAFRV
jgi:hypothetical protein